MSAPTARRIPSSRRRCDTENAVSTWCAAAGSTAIAND
jgi:hypothetical protein